MTSSDPLYAAFAHRPRPLRVKGCPCCVGPTREAAVLDVPLRELGPDIMGFYAFKAMTTFGTEEDFLALGVDTAPLLERWLASSSPRAGHLLAREVVDLAWWTNNSHSGGRSPDLDAMLVRDPRVRVAVARSRVIEETTAEHAMLLLDFPPFAYRT